MEHGITPHAEIPDDFVREQVERIAAGLILPEKGRHLIALHRKDHPRAHMRELYPEVFAASPVELHRDMRDYLEEYGRGLEPTRTDAGLAVRYARGVARWEAYGQAMMDGCGACADCVALRQEAAGSFQRDGLTAEDPGLRRLRLELRPEGYAELRRAFVDAAAPRRPLANLWADALDACSHGMAVRGEQTFAAAREYSAVLRERYAGAQGAGVQGGAGPGGARGSGAAGRWTPAGRIFSQVVELVDACGGDFAQAEARLAPQLKGR